MNSDYNENLERGVLSVKSSKNAEPRYLSAITLIILSIIILQTMTSTSTKSESKTITPILSKDLDDVIRSMVVLEDGRILFVEPDYTSIPDRMAWGIISTTGTSFDEFKESLPDDQVVFFIRVAPNGEVYGVAMPDTSYFPSGYMAMYKYDRLTNDWIRLFQYKGSYYRLDPFGFVFYNDDFIVTGFLRTSSESSKDAFIARFTKDGNLIWFRKYNIDNIGLYPVILLHGDNIYISFYSFNSSNSFYGSVEILQLDPISGSLTLTYTFQNAHPFLLKDNDSKYETIGVIVGSEVKIFDPRDMSWTTYNLGKPVYGVPFEGMNYSDVYIFAFSDENKGVQLAVIHDGVLDVVDLGYMHEGKGFPVNAYYSPGRYLIVSVNEQPDKWGTGHLLVYDSDVIESLLGPGGVTTNTATTTTTTTLSTTTATSSPPSTTILTTTTTSLTTTAVATTPVATTTTAVATSVPVTTVPGTTSIPETTPASTPSTFITTTPTVTWIVKPTSPSPTPRTTTYEERGISPGMLVIGLILLLSVSGAVFLLSRRKRGGGLDSESRVYSGGGGDGSVGHGRLDSPTSRGEQEIEVVSTAPLEATPGLDEVLELASRRLPGLKGGYGCSGGRLIELNGLVPSSLNGAYTCCLLDCGGWGCAYRCMNDDSSIVVKTPYGYQSVIEGGEVPSVSTKFMSRLAERAKTLFALQHPRIVKLLGYHRSIPMLVYEYAPYGSLDWQLSKGWDPSTRDSLLVGLQVGDGLRYIHSRGLVHGDIKPGNVFIGGEGWAKIGDFSGVVRLLSSVSRTRMPSHYTPGFRAPEQVFSDLKNKAVAAGLENRIDVYQYGNLLLYLLTGETIDGEEYHRAKETVLLIEDEDLRSLIYRMLAYDPVKRPSMEEVLPRLARIYSEIRT